MNSNCLGGDNKYMVGRVKAKLQNGSYDGGSVETDMSSG